ncbi:hypothetical protein EON64_08445 [archaeon]|nr:MAG: hypothetical protein EON64_08445 [archaeon]
MDSSSDCEYEDQYDGRDGEDDDYVYEEQDEDDQPTDPAGTQDSLGGPIPLERQLSSELMSFAIPLDNFVIKPASEIRPILFGLAKGVSMAAIALSARLSSLPHLAIARDLMPFVLLSPLRDMFHSLTLSPTAVS